MQFCPFLHCFVHLVHGYLLTFPGVFPSSSSIFSNMFWSLVAVVLVLSLYSANISAVVIVVLLSLWRLLQLLKRCSWVSSSFLQNLQVRSGCFPLWLFFAGNILVLALKSALALFLESWSKYFSLLPGSQAYSLPLRRNCTLVLFSASASIFCLKYLFVCSLMCCWLCLGRF